MVAERTHQDIVELTLPARAEFVAVVRLTVAAVARRMPFPAEEIEDLKLVIAEACTFLIDEADEHATMAVHCELGEAALRLEVRYITHTSRPHPAIDPSESKDMGLILIEALIDEVAVDQDDQGNRRLRMTKRVETRG